MESGSSTASVRESNLLLAAAEMMKDDGQVVQRTGRSENCEAGASPSKKFRSKIGGEPTCRNSTKKTTTLPNETVEYLKAWMMSPEHIAHPYPTETEKGKIMRDTGLELKQLTNWFVNNRKRYWKPRVEANLLKDQIDVLKPELSTSSIENSDALSELEKRGNGSFTFRRKEMQENLTSAVVTPTSYLRSSNARLISGQNSLASQSDGTTSCSDSDEERQTSPPRPLETTVFEEIDVHILRPSISPSTVPVLSDVSVLSNVPSELILWTYRKCSLIYGSFVKKNSKTSCRRDAEIIRLKKQYLSLYLSDYKAPSDESTILSTCPLNSPTHNPMKRKHEVHIIPFGTNNEIMGMASLVMSPRPKYRRHSIDVWKEACQTAIHVYDDDELPSLEEATRLFGYAN